MFSPGQRNKKKKFDQHLIQAQLERDYYNENTRLARKDRELVEENYIRKQGKVEYNSVDANAHYSFDWSQNVQVPYSSLLMGIACIVLYFVDVKFEKSEEKEEERNEE
jgi:hypothetical protein